jgi:parallel beta-helix repeat protein
MLRAKNPSLGRRLRLETLEPRCLLSTWQVPSQYSSIQGAINAASSGDTIQVAPGTYDGQLTISGKRLNIVSTGNAANTTINAGGGGCAVIITDVPSGTAAAGLSGFTITGGANSPTNQGGGVTVNSSQGIVIQSCVISNNTSYQGGGVYISNPTTCTIQNNQILDNTITNFGAGIYAADNASIVVSGNTISGNVCQWPSPTAPPSGGGILIATNTTAQITDNTITNNQGGLEGGAINFQFGCGGTISGNTISGNVAAYGGGVYLETQGAAETISGNTITGNQALFDSRDAGSGVGGGIAVFGKAQPTISNNIISGNQASVYGAGVSIAESSVATLQGNQILNNLLVAYSGSTTGTAGGGLYIVDSTATLTNDSLEGNAAYNGAGIYALLSSVLTLDYNNISGNTSTVGGGALFLNSGTTATITGNTFAADTAVANGTVPVALGGTMYIAGSGTNVTLTNNLVRDGVAENCGGIFIGDDASATLQNNTIVGNDIHQGSGFCGGLYIDGTVTSLLVRNNIFALNQGYQIYDSSPAACTFNTNFLTNDGTGMYYDAHSGVLTTAQALNADTATHASGNLSGATPGFVAPAANNFALAATSPCVNTGNPTGAPSVDIFGNPRKYVDIGAYEFMANLPQTPGLYDPTSSWWYLRNSNTTGGADITAGYGPPGGNWIPLSGDWTGDGIDTIGLYNPATGFFYLHNSNTTGVGDITFFYGATGQGWMPVVGDWTGKTSSAGFPIDTIGLYDPKTCTWYLRNELTTGVADITIGYGPPGAGWLPLVGDWDGNGTTTVGLYNPATGYFYLRNSNTTGAGDITFFYGDPSKDWIPVAGDWTGVGHDSIGMYDPATGTWYLRNALSTGVADLTFGFGAVGAGWLPVVGDWTVESPGAQTLAASSTVNSLSASTPLVQANTVSVDPSAVGRGSVIDPTLTTDAVFQTV